MSSGCRRPEQERADDLEAIANVVREPKAAVDRSRPRPAGRGAASGGDSRPGSSPGPPRLRAVGQGVEVGRRGHLRVLRSAPVQPE